MKLFIALFALIAAASAGYISNYAPEAQVISVHESHAPLVTTLHHHGVAASAGAALTYAAPAAAYHTSAAAFGYHAPAAAFGYHAPAAGYVSNYAPEAQVLSVHQSHAPLVTTLHHHGVAASAGAALTYAAPAAAVYAAPAYGNGYGYGYDMAAWRQKRSEQ